MVGCFICSSSPSASPSTSPSSSSILKRHKIGRLDLGVINPVTEGLTLIWGTALLSGLLGNDLWVQKSFIGGLPLNQIMIYFSLAVLIINNALRLGH